MNDNVIRQRSASVGSSPNLKPTHLQNQTKAGKLDGKSVKLETTGDVKSRLSLKSDNVSGSKPIEGLALGSVSIGEDDPPQISERGGKEIKEKPEKGLNTLLKRVNSEPNLRERQEMLSFTSEILQEVEGIQPSTTNDIEKLVRNLKECDLYLENELSQMEFEEQASPTLSDIKPLKLQKEIVLSQREQIKEITEDLLEVPVPPKPFGGAAAKDLLGQVDKNYVSVLSDLNNTPDSHDAVNLLKDAMVDIRGAIGLLQKTPSDRLQMGLVADQMGHHLKNIADHLSGPFKEVLKLPVLAPISNEISALLEGLKTELKSAQTSLNEAAGLNPMSEKGIFHSKTFSTKGAITLLENLLKTAVENPRDLKADGPSIEGMEPEVNTDNAVKVLQNAIQFLKDRVDQLELRNSDKPITEDEAEALMGSEGADHGIESKSGKAELKKMLEGIKLDGNPVTTKLPDSHRKVREDGILELFVGHALKQAGLKKPENLRGELLEHRYGALNSQKWEPISKEVLLQRDGKTHKMQSEIVPQSNLGAHFKDMNGGGVVCHRSSEYEHGTTVAVTKLTASDGTKLFEGVRHGVINCYGISSKTLSKMPKAELEKMVKDLLPVDSWKKEGNVASLSKTVKALQSNSIFARGYNMSCAREMREEGSWKRVNDIVITHLCKNEEKLKLALSESGKEKPKEVVINLNQIGLLTPSPMNNVRGRSGPKNESKMLEEQMATLQRLAGDPQPKTLTIQTEDGPKKVTVRVNVNAFNFGVNNGAFQGIKDGTIGRLGRLISGWHNSDRHNETAMNTLIGKPKDRKDGAIGGQVGEFIKNRDIPMRQRLIVKELADQVASMWDNGDYKKAGREPYKMVSRLALLTNMIGGDTSWNCKSGKDRTGGLDVEVKRIAAEIYMTGRVPEPGAKDNETKANRFRMQVNGGNFEIQNYNTGAPGFKLGGVPALKGQINEHSNDTR